MNFQTAALEIMAREAGMDDDKALEYAFIQETLMSSMPFLMT